MLNLKETTFKMYEPVFENLQPVTRRKIRAAYDKGTTYTERIGVLVYVANSVKAKKLGTSLDAVMFHIEKQAFRLEGVSSAKLVEALTVIEKFNWMNVAYTKFKFENEDEFLPYIMFDTCFWYADAVELLTGFEKEEYPLVQDWEEFFRFLPMSGELNLKNRGGNVLGIKDYVWAVKDGKFRKWYQKEKGYGVRLSEFAGRGFADMYKAEIAEFDNDELVEEFLKFSWGHPHVKAEIRRRDDGK